MGKLLVGRLLAAAAAAVTASEDMYTIIDGEATKGEEKLEIQCTSDMKPLESVVWTISVIGRPRPCNLGWRELPSKLHWTDFFSATCGQIWRTLLWILYLGNVQKFA